MTQMHDNTKKRRGRTDTGTKVSPNRDRAPKPGWAGGLRQLYDSVLEEPLPSSFSDLLAKLDGKDQ